jgi:hypothetical protein
MSLPQPRRIFLRQRRRARPARELAAIVLAAACLMSLAGVGVVQMAQSSQAAVARR